MLEKQQQENAGEMELADLEGFTAMRKSITTKMKSLPSVHVIRGKTAKR